MKSNKNNLALIRVHKDLRTKIKVKAVQNKEKLTMVEMCNLVVSLGLKQLQK